MCILLDTKNMSFMCNKFKILRPTNCWDLFPSFYVPTNLLVNTSDNNIEEELRIMYVTKDSLQQDGLTKADSTKFLCQKMDPD